MSEYYRGLSRNYSNSKIDSDSFADNFKPSYFRDSKPNIKNEADHYQRAFEHIQTIESRLNSKTVLKEVSPKFLLKILGYIQHYSYSSRLLDVSESHEVAEYFACSSDFDEDGFIVTFAGSSFTKRTPDAEVSVHHKLQAFLSKEFNPKRDYSKNKHIIINYVKAFNTKSTNLRYERQRGSFILFEPNDDGTVNYQLKNGTDYNVETISAEKKMERLLELSEKGFNYVNLFPDNDESIKTSSLYARLKLDLFVNFDESLKSVFGDTNSQYVDRLKKYMKEEAVFYLVLNELKPLLGNNGDEDNLKQLCSLLEKKYQVPGKKGE